jgi:hypothetical protein
LNQNPPPPPHIRWSFFLSIKSCFSLSGVQAGTGQVHPPCSRPHQAEAHPCPQAGNRSIVFPQRFSVSVAISLLDILGLKPVLLPPPNFEPMKFFRKIFMRKKVLMTSFFNQRTIFFALKKLNFKKLQITFECRLSWIFDSGKLRVEIINFCNLAEQAIFLS